MAVTKMDSVTSFGGVKVCQCPIENKGASHTREWDIGAERGIVGVNVRVGGTEAEIPSEATKGWGSPVHWAMADRERV